MSKFKASHPARPYPVNNFTVIESVYGRFVVNRHCAYQAEALIKTGATHIENELAPMFTIVGTLPVNAVIVDVGANAGFVCVPLANAVREKGGQVLAYEVQRMMFNALCGTVALNDLDNLRVFNQGMGAEAGQLKVPVQNYSKPQDFGMVSLVNQDQIQAHEIVQIITLDSVPLQRLDFLKIDVEGMELEVLAGGKQAIARHRPWCWIEYWMIDSKALKDFFAPLEYTLYRMDKLNVLCAPNEHLGANRVNINGPLF